MGEKWVKVYQVEGLVLAELTRNFLISRGIQAVTAQEAAGAAYGLTVGPLGSADILVPESQQAEALEVLTALENGEFELKDGPAEETPPEEDEVKE